MFQPSMEPEDSLSCSKESTHGLYTSVSDIYLFHLKLQDLVYIKSVELWQKLICNLFMFPPNSKDNFSLLL
jgi:hypothetical protein